MVRKKGRGMNLLQLQEVWNSGRVKRCHTVPSDGTQNIADHSWGVCAIMFFLCDKPSVNVLRAALFHDCAESITGDIPAHAKWSYRFLKETLDNIEAIEEQRMGIDYELDTEELELLKVCDLLELYLYAWHRMRMGDSYYTIIQQRVGGKLEENTGARNRYPKIDLILCP